MKPEAKIVRNALPRFAGALAVFIVTWGAAPLEAHPNHSVGQIAQLKAGEVGTEVPRSAVQSAARLSVTITDAQTGLPTPARVRITDPEGNPLGVSAKPNLPTNDPARLAVPGSVIGLPEQAVAVMYGQNDTAQGYAFQPDGAFYVSGKFDMPMPAGKFIMTIAKGYEYEKLREEVAFASGQHVTRDYKLRRWVDMPAKGWYSADDHIHLRRSPRDNPMILDWLAAEDLHVGVLLQVGDSWMTYFSQYGFGKRGLYGKGSNFIMSGQEEPRTSELGHTLSLGAEEFVRIREDYYSYDRVFDRVHALGGVTGYAHQAMSFRGFRGMTLDVIEGKIDFLELMQFCVRESPLALDHYYRFLDLGYKVTALAGSDFPWCGRGGRPGEEQVGPQIGDARFYTWVDGPFSFERWFAAVKAGRTFVTTGPVIELEVNGRKPGAALDVKPGAKLRISATARGHNAQIPLQRMAIIGHGKVLAEVDASQPAQSAAGLTIEHELTAEHGIWLAARVDAGPTQVAHTTPVYVTVNGDGFHNRSNLDAQIDLSKRYLQEIRELLAAIKVPSTQTPPATQPGIAAFPRSHPRLEQRIANVERILEELRGRK